MDTDEELRAAVLEANNPGTDMQANSRDAVRRSPRQERSRAKVEAILAAVETIAADEPAALTTSSIAEQAQISVGSLYQYFENREDIVERLLERYRGELDEVVDKAFADGTIGTLGAGIRAVLDRYVEFARSRPAFRTLWYSTEFHNPHRVVFDPVDHALTSSFLDAAFTHGVVTTPDADTRTHLFAVWTALDAVIHAAFRLDPSGETDLIEEAHHLAEGIETAA